jgi:hypothetical protein
VNDPGGDKEFLTDGRANDVSSDLELDVALKDHHHFVNGMPIIFPGLTGRVIPDVAAEAAGMPVGSNCGGIYHCDRGGLSSSGTIKRASPLSRRHDIRTKANLRRRVNRRKRC